MSFAKPAPLINHSLKKLWLSPVSARRNAKLKRVPRERGINSVVSQLVIGHARRARDRRNQRGMIHECKRTSYASRSRGTFSEFWHVTCIYDRHFLIKIQAFSSLMLGRHALVGKKEGHVNKYLRPFWGSYPACLPAESIWTTLNATPTFIRIRDTIVKRTTILSSRMTHIFV